MKFSMIEQEKGELSIQVTACTGLIVLRNNIATASKIMCYIFFSILTMFNQLVKSS